MIDRMATLRTGFLTTRACGPDGIYELKATFQSLDDLDAADQELRDALERERIDLGPLTALASQDEAPAPSAASAQPMFYASPEQANALQDRPDDSEGGVYLPLRKTAAGKFTMPLYAAPTQQAVMVDAPGASLRDECGASPEEWAEFTRWCEDRRATQPTGPQS